MNNSFDIDDGIEREREREREREWSKLRFWEEAYCTVLEERNTATVS
jgi:hypothetical protein